MIKKAVGLVLSLTIVIGVLSAFGVMYFMSLQDGIMNGIFINTDEALEEDDESEAPNTKKEDNNYTGEILMIVLLVATASSIIFAITLASDVRNKKITKEKLNAAIEVMIQKEIGKKKGVKPQETSEQAFVPVNKPIRFELGGFVDSEVNRLLINDYTPANKRMTVMTDMNSLSHVIEYITDKIGDGVKMELKAEIAALIVFSGENLSFEDEEIQKLNKIMSDAMGSFVFEDDKAIIKLPIIPEL